ncbi:MAG: hypothetical protein HC790_05765 [Acaryochloridaceae cyanobacterium CSU_3_4]|nr:hypothetical protein [Acaryochloridaceae cyanobacterium CSU_3_4]
MEFASRRKNTQLFRRLSVAQSQQDSPRFPTQERIENVAFDQNTSEMFNLQKEEGTITPVEQERLGVLKGKMDDFRSQRQERVSRLAGDFTHIPIQTPGRYPAVQLQSKLRFGISDVMPEIQSPPKSRCSLLSTAENAVQRREMPVGEGADGRRDQPLNADFNPQPRAIRVATHPQTLEGNLQRKQSSSPVIQRMVGMNSKGINGEIQALISDPSNIEKMTEAYTFLQHISWAYNIVGGKLFDMSKPAFQDIGTTENLILVAHGAKGKSGSYNGATIAGFLADKTTGLPDNWEGSVYITSCYSGTGAAPLVQAVAEKLKELGKPNITVTGYAGTTVTHKEFDEFIFVVNPKKESEFKEVSAQVQLKYQNLFKKWYIAMQKLTPDNILEMANYTSNLTAEAYKTIVTAAAEQDVFLDEAQGEVSRTS